MLSNMLWYAARYRAERRHLRQMMRGYRLKTGRMALVIVILMAAIALWVLWPPPAMAEALYALTVDDYANVRDRPSKQAVDVGDLYAGDIVQGLDYSQGWVLVAADVEAGQGWVRADLLTLDGMPTGQYRNTSGGRVRVRAEPDGKPVGWLKAGGTADVQRWVDNDGAAWAYVGTGYVSGEWLEVEP